MDSVPVAQILEAMKVTAELKALLEGQATARVEPCDPAGASLQLRAILAENQGF
jgi:hypothetical protein